MIPIQVIGSQDKIEHSKQQAKQNIKNTITQNVNKSNGINRELVIKLEIIRNQVKENNIFSPK